MNTLLVIVICQLALVGLFALFLRQRLGRSEDRLLTRFHVTRVFLIFTTVAAIADAIWHLYARHSLPSSPLFIVALVVYVSHSRLSRQLKQRQQSNHVA